MSVIQTVAVILPGEYYLESNDKRQQLIEPVRMYIDK